MINYLRSRFLGLARGGITASEEINLLFSIKPEECGVTDGHK